MVRGRLSVLGTTIMLIAGIWSDAQAESPAMSFYKLCQSLTGSYGSAFCDAYSLGFVNGFMFGRMDVRYHSERQFRIVRQIFDIGLSKHRTSLWSS
jgi:hypothetical protein